MQVYLQRKTKLSEKFVKSKNDRKKGEIIEAILQFLDAEVIFKEFYLALL